MAWITLFSLLRRPNLPKPDCTFAEKLERRIAPLRRDLSAERRARWPRGSA